MNNTNTPSLVEEPPPADLGWKPDDDKLAIRLSKDLNHKLAFFHSEWKEYLGGCWRARSPHQIRKSIRAALVNYREKNGVSVTQSRIRGLAAMLEDDLHIGDEIIMEKQQQQAHYVNLRNGLFNLDTMTFEARHDPELYFTTQLGFDYDPDADCPVFRRYLNSSLVFPDGKTDFSLVHLATEALAYSMTARTDLKASFWLVGQKDSGKSTFIALIKSLMGDLHTTIDLTQLGVNRFLLAGIVGKRVLTFTEASSSTMLPDALYKALTGGSDEIYADVKNRDPITFRPEAKVWWAMNEMPRMGDRSGATARRIIIIPFNRTIPESGRIANLEQQLAAERSGIFNELMAKLLRVQRAGGFDRCEQSEALLAEYIMENDTEATFVQEECEVGKDYRVKGSELHQRYVWWCEQGAFKPKNRNQIAKDWRRLGFESFASNGAWWRGLQLRKIL